MLRRACGLRRALVPLARPFTAPLCLHGSNDALRRHVFPHFSPPLTRPFCDKSKTAAPEAEGLEPEAEAAEEAAPGPDWEGKVAALEQDAKKLQDGVRLALAEAENARSIAKKDVASARDFAISKFAKGLLDVADNFDRAIAAAKSGEDEDPAKRLADLLGGVEMIQAQLAKTFGEHGLVKYGAVGDRFDPHVHEAMFEYPDPDKEVGSVGQVLLPGYKLKERVVRPAQVGTVKT